MHTTKGTPLDINSEIDSGTVTACAEVAHEANRILCAATGDASQVPWSHADEWQRASALKGDATALAGASPRDQHDAWCRDKIAEGWRYGQTKDPVAKTHPCLVAYDQLPPAQRAKDALFGAVVRAMKSALDAAKSRPAATDSQPMTEAPKDSLRAAVQAFITAVQRDIFVTDDESEFQRLITGLVTAYESDSDRPRVLPPPRVFTIHPSVWSKLRHFRVASEMPPKLAPYAVPFADLADALALRLEGPELTVCLSKLIEARDAALRAAADLP